MEGDEFQSSNINRLWLNNIYENIKNLETMVRLAREGCLSLAEYMQIPFEQRAIILPDVQYKNMRMISNEMNLLLTDLVPVLGKEKVEEYLKILFSIEKVIDQRKLFVKDNYSSVKKQVVSSSTTEFFFETLRFLEVVRRNIIIDISSILYAKTDNQIKQVNKEFI